MPPNSTPAAGMPTKDQIQAKSPTPYVPEPDPNATDENIYTQICGNIIKEQNKIIGNLAIEQAALVEGLKVDPVTFKCHITGVGAVVIEKLIDQYRDFFGHAAVAVCREAASKYLTGMSTENIPESLR